MNRRTFLVAGAMAAAGSAARLRAAPARPRPSRAQLVWQRDEIALFFHFGVNTFSNRESNHTSARGPYRVRSSDDVFRDRLAAASG